MAILTRPPDDPAVAGSKPVDLGNRRERSMALYVADDHPLILESIKSLFRAFDPAALVVGFASLQALEAALVPGQLPDIVMVDFSMPGLASVDAVGHFLERHPDLRTSVISGEIDGQLARALIRRGCYGFVPKSLTPTAIYHAVRLMVNGGRFIPDLLLEASQPPSAPLGGAGGPVGPAGGPGYGLTRREAETLRSLAAGRTNKQIARELSIEEVTVKLHLRRCYAKLKVRNRVEAVRLVFDGALDGAGFRFCVEGHDSDARKLA